QELDDAGDLAAQADGKAHGAMQPCPLRRLGSRKVSGVHDVVDPDRMRRLPDPPGQAGTLAERTLAGVVEKRRGVAVGAMPDVHSSQYARLAVDEPEDADRPVRSFSERPEELRGDLVERTRGRQQPRQGV